MNPDGQGSMRLVNQIKARLDATHLSERVLALPSTFYIGLCTICDIRCPYCPRQFYREDIDPGLMDFDEFLKITPYLKYGEEAIFFGLGEPFLHPRFFDFLKSIRLSGIKISTSTHGMSLKPDVRNKLLDFGLDELAISIDAADKKTFEFLRKGAIFEEVIANLLALREEKKRRGSKKPDLHIATAVSRHNVDQMTKIVELGNKLGASRVLFTDLILVDPQNASLSVSKTDLFHKHYQRARVKGDKLGIEVIYFHQYPFPWKKEMAPLKKASNKRRYMCKDPWRVCIINRHGWMKPCCYYPPDTGNVFRESLEDVINNEANTELRRRLIEGNLPECCINCGMLSEWNPGASGKALKEAESMLEEARRNGRLSKTNIRELSQLVTDYKERLEKVCKEVGTSL